MAIKCSKCNVYEPSKAGVIKGKYYSNVCVYCFDLMLADQAVSSGHAEFNRQRDFEDKQTDVAQPYTKDGKPSRDFIKLYPERSKKLFDQDTIRKAQ